MRKIYWKFKKNSKILIKGKLKSNSILRTAQNFLSIFIFKCPSKIIDFFFVLACKRRRRKKAKSAKSNYFTRCVQLWAKYFYTFSKNSFIVCVVRIQKKLESRRHAILYRPKPHTQNVAVVKLRAEEAEGMGRKCFVMLSRFIYSASKVFERTNNCLRL